MKNCSACLVQKHTNQLGGDSQSSKKSNESTAHYTFQVVVNSKLFIDALFGVFQKHSLLTLITASPKKSFPGAHFPRHSMDHPSQLSQPEREEQKEFAPPG